MLGGAAAAWPLAAQDAAAGECRVIGFLGLGSSDPSSAFGVRAFRQGLADARYARRAAT